MCKQWATVCSRRHCRGQGRCSCVKAEDGRARSGLPWTCLLGHTPWVACDFHVCIWHVCGSAKHVASSSHLEIRHWTTAGLRLSGGHREKKEMGCSCSPHINTNLKSKQHKWFYYNPCLMFFQFSVFFPGHGAINKGGPEQEPKTWFPKGSTHSPCECGWVAQGARRGQSQMKKQPGCWLLASQWLFGTALPQAISTRQSQLGLGRDKRPGHLPGREPFQGLSKNSWQVMIVKRVWRIGKYVLLLKAPLNLFGRGGMVWSQQAWVYICTSTLPHDSPNKRLYRAIACNTTHLLSQLSSDIGIFLIFPPNLRGSMKRNHKWYGFWGTVIKFRFFHLLADGCWGKSLNRKEFLHLWNREMTMFTSEVFNMVS